MNSNYHHQNLYQPTPMTQLDLSHLQDKDQVIGSHRLFRNDYHFTEGLQEGRMEGLRSSRLSNQMKITLNSALRQPRSMVSSRQNSRSRDQRGQELGRQYGLEQVYEPKPLSSAIKSQLSSSEQPVSQASTRATKVLLQSKPSSRRSSNAYIYDQINGGQNPLQPNSFIPVSSVGLNNQVFNSQANNTQQQLPYLYPLDSQRKSAGGALNSHRSSVGNGSQVTAPLLPQNLANKKMPQDFFRDYHQHTRVNNAKLGNVRMKRQALLDQSQILFQPDQSLLLIPHDGSGNDNMSFNESLNLSHLHDQQYPQQFTRRKGQRVNGPIIVMSQFSQDLLGDVKFDQSQINTARLHQSENNATIVQAIQESQQSDNGNVIYRTIDQKPQELGSSYKIGQISKFTSSNVRTTSIEKRESQEQHQQSLGDFSSLSLAKAPGSLNQSLAFVHPKQLFSPEREPQKYVMKPICIKAKSTPAGNESGGQLLQTANFPNGPVQEPTMVMSPGYLKNFSQSGQVDLSMMKEDKDYQKENSPGEMNISQEMQRLMKPRRSNSQGSDAAYIFRRKSSKTKQLRGMAQRVVLPKNSSFLSISGISSHTGNQIVMDGFNPQQPQTIDKQVCRDQLPQGLINFNISFGNFPKLENYPHFKSSTQVLNSPIIPDLNNENNNSYQKNENLYQHLTGNLSPKNSGQPHGIANEKTFIQQSPLIIESAFKSFMTTEKKTCDAPADIIESPVFVQKNENTQSILPEDHNKSFLDSYQKSFQRHQQSRCGETSSRQQYLDEIRRTLKTPCFNQSAQKQSQNCNNETERKTKGPKVVFPKMII